MFSDFLKKLFAKEPKSSITGVIEDARSIEEKDKDYNANEVVAFGAVEWKEKTEDQWRKFPIVDQDGSFSCMAQAGKKALGIENYNEEERFINFSAKDIYSRRFNYPDPGMSMYDLLSICSKYGASLEQFIPSEKISESEMNKPIKRTLSDKQIADTFKAGGYLMVDINIDKIANIINQGKGVVLLFRFNFKEWTDVPKNLNLVADIGHGVTAVDYFMYQGSKALLIEDSWGASTAKNGRRIITEKFLNTKCLSAGYFKNLNNNWKDTGIIKPRPESFIFDHDLKYGNYDQDVSNLQEVLKYEEFFPQDTDNTIFYGNITAQGVLAFQRKYKVAPSDQLDLLAGRAVGPATRKKLNELYG